MTASGGSPRDGALPSGTVTLLLSDIERSTHLWESHPAEMTAAIAELDATVEEVVSAHGGVRPVEQGEGDSFVAAFGRATDAVACALALQQATRDSLLRLRMGVHSGDVQLRDGANYVGPTINRAARIRDAGHGGQVLLSATTADLVRDDLPGGASLVDLGEHRLRDLTRPERVWQLAHPDLDADHPPLRLSPAVRASLPASLTTFIGRDAERVAVHDLLTRARAVTLTGAGGCGKTRLAVHVAGECLGDHPDGVWFVDFAATRDPDAVGAVAAEALGLQVLRDEPLDLIARAIGNQGVLLVIDNCEHLLGPCAALADTLLRRCPGLVVLSTSREPLGIEGEVTFRIPSLPLPVEAADPESIAGADAIRLFVDRAGRARPGFALDATNASVVAEICRRLDGIPLAIELAAARLRVLTPAQVRDGLRDRFRLLTGGARTALPRQQTLQASVEWSYDLLLEAERSVLDRLSVFAGGFDLDAAGSVCSGGALEPHHVVDLVMQLVDKSLVVPIEEAGRFTLLETVRTFAMQRLVDVGEAEEVRARHYRVFLDRTRLEGDEGSYRRQIAADYDNIRRALEWAEVQDDHRLLARLCARLHLYWATGMAIRDGTTWMERVAGRETDPSRRPEALGRYALLLSLIGDPDRSVAVAREAVDGARALGDPRALSWTLLFLAQAFPFHDEQVEAAREARDLAREVGDRQAEAYAVHQLGWQQMDYDPVLSATLLQEALQLSRAGGFAWIEQLSGATLAFVDVRLGKVRDALPALEAAARALADAGEGTLRGTVLAWIVGVRAIVGDWAGAERALEELTNFARTVQAVGALIRAEMSEAWVALHQGRFEDAVATMHTVIERPADPALRSAALAMLAAAEALAGRPKEAVIHADASTAITPVGWRGSPLGSGNYTRALATRASGDLPHAEELAHAAIAEVHELPLPVYIQTAPVHLLASLMVRTGRVDDGVRLFAGAAARLDAAGVDRSSAVIAAEVDGQVAAACDAVGAARFEQLWSEGAAMAWEEVIAYARRGRGERKRPRSGWESLTPTELQVITLVAAGASNGEIAERLFMSVPTVKSHLTHVYTKLGIPSRARLAAEATRRGAAGDL